VRAQDRPQERRAAASASADEDLSSDVLHVFWPLPSATPDQDIQQAMEVPLERRTMPRWPRPAAERCLMHNCANLARPAPVRLLLMHRNKNCVQGHSPVKSKSGGGFGPGK
jgi:hypothetical protein